MIEVLEHILGVRAKTLAGGPLGQITAYYDVRSAEGDYNETLQYQICFDRKAWSIVDEEIVIRMSVRLAEQMVEEAKRGSNNEKP